MYQYILSTYFQIIIYYTPIKKSNVYGFLKILHKKNEWRIKWKNIIYLYKLILNS